MTNTVTWTASVIGGPSAVATDTATVLVNTAAPLVCNGNTVLFDRGSKLPAATGKINGVSINAEPEAAEADTSAAEAAGTEPVESV